MVGRMLDLYLGTLHSGSADLTIMFICRTNGITEIVQAVMIPTSSLCQSDIVGPAAQADINVVIQDEVFHYGRDMMPFSHHQHQLVGHQATGLCQV